MKERKEGVTTCWNHVQLPKRTEMYICHHDLIGSRYPYSFQCNKYRGSFIGDKEDGAGS